jgi:hypothetical protein
MFKMQNITKRLNNRLLHKHSTTLGNRLNLLNRIRSSMYRPSFNINKEIRNQSIKKRNPKKS